jgi:hypothetical protein
MKQRTFYTLLAIISLFSISCKEAATTAPEIEEPGIGSGTWRVGTAVAPGRYYTNPRSGCYFERLSGFGGTLDDIIANEFIGFDAGQWIIEIATSDAGFSTNSECGRWNQERPSGGRSSITPGVWEVGTQITPGRYRTTAAEGCYWERLRAFGANLSSIIANDFNSSSGQRIVDIQPSDAGFSSNDSCGTWERLQ